MLALGRAIRVYRTRKGISQKGLADAAGISPSFLSHVESDRRAASFTVVERIALAMGIAPEVLLWEAIELPDEISDEDKRTFDIAKLIVKQVYANAHRTSNDPPSLQPKT